MLGLDSGLRVMIVLGATVAYPWDGAAPLFFEPNRGQFAADASFVARGHGFQLGLRPGEAWLRPDGTARCGEAAGKGGPFRGVLMRLSGSDLRSELVPEARLSGVTHYVRGRDASRWISGVPRYRRVVDRGVYAGIDLVYYSREGTLAFDLRVSPGADASAIELAFDGADAVAVDHEGELEIRVGAHHLRIGRPLVYQDRGPGRVEIPSQYTLSGGNRVRFRLGDYDASRALTIDPVLRYCTYLGGAGDDIGRAAAVDGDGFVYITGSTDTLGLPTEEPGQGDAFVVKLDPRSSEIVYAVYLGGDARDIGRGIEVDANGSAYVVGETSSTNFPLANPFQSELRGLADAFVVKLDPSGASLQYGTYFGGSGFESARGVAVDPWGRVALMGQTISPDLPLANAFQSGLAGFVDAFVTMLDASGSGIVFSTFLGGSGHDLPFHKEGCGTSGDSPGWDVDIDDEGAVYVAGTTESLDFPVMNAFQENHGTGLRDGFVAKFAPGGALAYSTFLGGSGGDSARGIAVDRFGRVSVTGATRSTDFPVSADAVQSENHGVYDAFLVRLDQTGSSLIYATYLGGVLSDAASAVALDSHGRPVIVGQTLSSHFPVLNAFQPANQGSQDTFISGFDESGAIAFSSFLGGSGLEVPCGVNMGVAVDALGTAFIAGATDSLDFPVTPDAVQAVSAGALDAFAAEVRLSPEILVSIRSEGGEDRLRVSVANHATTGYPVDVKIWIELDDGSRFPVLPVPYSLTMPTGSTELFDVSLPGTLPFPGTTIGGRLIEPDTGLTISASLCSKSPCN